MKDRVKKGRSIDKHMTRWKMKETMKERKKFKHWISPMSKHCQGQNRQIETCRGTHCPRIITQIQSNLFTQQAQKDDNMSPKNMDCWELQKHLDKC